MDNLDNIYQNTWEKISTAKYVLIITHINPDPDTLTSALAISDALSQLNIKHKIFNDGKKIPNNLKFLNKIDRVVDKIPEFYDLAISVDCGDKNRFFKNQTQEFDKTKFLINIDHHVSNDNFGNINIVDIKSASTAEIVYNLIVSNKAIKITKNIAEAIYVGIYTDTIGFTTNRVNNSTFKKISHLVESGANPELISNHLVYNDSLAKYRLIPKILDSLELHYEGKVATIVLETAWLKSTGAQMEDAETALNMVTQIGIIDMVLFLRQSNTRVRVSLRGKNNTDVSKIASAFGGGGHILAAGCVFEDNNVEVSKKILLEEIGKLYEL